MPTTGSKNDHHDPVIGTRCSGFRVDLKHRVRAASSRGEPRLQEALIPQFSPPPWCSDLEPAAAHNPSCYSSNLEH